MIFLTSFYNYKEIQISYPFFVNRNCIFGAFCIEIQPQLLLCFNDIKSLCYLLYICEKPKIYVPKGFVLPPLFRYSVSLFPKEFNDHVMNGVPTVFYLLYKRIFSTLAENLYSFFVKIIKISSSCFHWVFNSPFVPRLSNISYLSKTRLHLFLSC